jgi:hypothetical protein
MATGWSLFAHLVFAPAAPQLWMLDRLQWRP